jgi:hypothetical protein
MFVTISLVLTILMLFFSFFPIVPSLPAPRGHARTRVEETPTHTGGLSESARQKLEERRKNRDKQKGMYGLFHDFTHVS